jgi:ABC-type multidrug transport system ATPase subunit
MDGQDSLLSLRGVSVRRGRNLVLENLDFMVKPGEFILLTGPNGSGKSTLLQALAGLLPLSTGELYHDNNKIRDSDGRHAFSTNIIGWCPQGSSSTSCSTVEEHLRTILSLNGISLTNDKETELLIEWGLDHRRHDRIVNLSGGLRRRLEVASAIAIGEGASKIVPILLDEPSVGLDEKGRNTLVSAIQRLRDAGHTIIIATHHSIIESINDEFTETITHGDFQIQRSKQNEASNLPIRSSKVVRKASMLRWNFRLDLREMATPSARWIPGLLAFGILLGSGLIDAEIPNLGLAALALSPAMISALIRPALVDRLDFREMGGVWSVSKQGALGFEVAMASLSIVPAILGLVGLLVLFPIPNTIQGLILFFIIPLILIDVSAVSGLIHHRFGSGERPGIMVLLMIPFAWVLLTLCSAVEAVTLEAMKEAWTGVIVAIATNIGLFLLAWALHE